MFQALYSGSRQMTLHEEAQMASKDHVLAVRSSLDAMKAEGHGLWPRQRSREEFPRGRRASRFPECWFRRGGHRSLCISARKGQKTTRRMR